MLWVHANRPGSVEALTNEAGTVVERRSYDAFGARRNPAWGAPPSASFTTTSSLGFTGHEQEDEIPGALNAVNPLYQLDYRAVGAAGVKTVALGAAAVVGAAQSAGALAARGAAARAAPSVAVKRSPNPYGRKGGPAHQLKMQQIADDIRSRGLDPAFEYKVRTPGGAKSHRYVDVVARDAQRKVVEMHQVAQQNARGHPVPREVRAMDDIERATSSRPLFHPYN